ncbi:MAG: hypothetical protein IH621_00020 [Krumholzibacteria bacterium]|nr:hypothetical protein [Candidatus Krumholzibacteria bacterium]
MIACLLVLLAALGDAPAAALDDTAVVPYLPWVEVVRAPAQPASLFCTPAGGGSSFAAADAFGGGDVDAGLEIILYSDQPPWGTPIAHFPAQDIWLEASDGTLVACHEGTVADANTDTDGRTGWALPLRVGGALDRGTGARLLVVVNGDSGWGQDELLLGVNSADLDGDGQVNLTDAGLFSQDLFGAYAYRSDFVWDGVINISDAGRMSQALGQRCP